VAAPDVTMTGTAPAAAGDQVEVRADAEISGEDTENDDDDPADMSSSEEDELADPDAEPERQMFVCCMDDKKTGGFWWCPGCSKCFHNACDASATRDGSNKVCVPCHVQMMSGSDRATRRRTK